MKTIRAFSIIAIAALAMSGCTQVDTGNVGVESTFGQVKPQIMPPGVYFTAFKKVIEVSAKELPLQLENLRPQTTDKITLADLDVDIYVQIDASKAAEIITRWPGDVVSEKGEEGSRIGMNYVSRQAREAVYSAVSKRGSATIHTERTALGGDIVKMLQADLDESAGKGWFFVRSANVRNLVTDPALEANIKAAANAQFEEQRKTREIEVAKKEADRKRIEAQGEADAIRIRAQAIAVQGGKEYVDLKAIEKWDGKLPTMTGGGAVPFIHVPAGK